MARHDFEFPYIHIREIVAGCKLCSARNKMISVCFNVFMSVLFQYQTNCNMNTKTK
jgi:hypothetical protein